jgi:outer membrane protein TolC
MLRQIPMSRATWKLIVVLALFSSFVIAQTSPAPPPPIITLDEAIRRAQLNSVEFGAARTAYGTANANITIARSAILPNVKGEAQYLYTQGTGTPSTAFPGGTPIFIANNAVHEYIGQANVHQDLSLALAYDYRRTQADSRVAKARLEIAKRGLAVVVVQRFYGLAVAQRKLATSQSAREEAQHFLKVSEELEAGGEVAHSDVIKAQIEANDKQRAFQEAELAVENARLDLALLLFKDFNQNFSIADDLSTPTPLPTMDELAVQARKSNPDLAAALAARQSADYEVRSARSEYLPTLGFEYWYGLDSTRVGWRIDGIRNVGYAAAATLTVPVWNWGATHAHVQQAELARRQAQLELTTAQKTLLAQMQSLYAEARVSLSELDSLRQSAALTADSLRLTEARYRGGEATVLEVVDAQNTLTLSRNAYDDGELRYRVALANLQTLTGTLNP